MSGTYELDNALFPRNPLVKTWTPDQVGRRGTREPIFTDIWRLELQFSTLETIGEHNFFMTRFMAGGLYDATLPHPTTGQLTSFTGVSIESYRAPFNDIDSDGWAENPTLVLGVDIRATGSA
jgi:hypothetical protein